MDTTPTTRVLVVDDSLTVRMELQEALQLAGFSCDSCATLTDARQHLARGDVGLMVLDVLLPDGDGIEFLDEIKSLPRFAGIPVLLLTTEGEVRDRVRGLKVGADDYIGKPYDTAYVVARAHELLPRASTPATVPPGPTILVVDDSLTLREELKTTLTDAGYVVVTAENGEEGLRIAAQRRPDALVVDGSLPGMDGAEVVRRIRHDSALRRMPCVLLTGSQGFASEVQALDAGADAYVRKGEPPEVLLLRLGALLRSRGGPAALEARSSLLGSKKALAVDDSPTYLAELAGHLHDEGYDVALARSGEEALELLDLQAVECVLLDLMMPGMSGQETCRRIKATPAWRNIPVLILTARDDDSAMIEGINAGADDYVCKTSDFEVLKARLRAQMRRRRYEEENQRMLEELRGHELEAARARAARELAETRAALMADLEQKNVQLQQSNAELEAFSYSVSHDLRAPLRHIAGFTELLAKHAGATMDETAHRYLEKVKRAARDMGELIDDLLSFSRMGRTDLTTRPVDLASLVREVSSDLERDAEGRQIEWTYGELPLVMGSPEMLRLALVNLLANAVKYTRGKPCAKVEVTSWVAADGQIVVRIRDNGVGFDMKYADKLFGVFQRLHRNEDFEGTGIGLATVRRIISRHGGRTWAEGVVGEGASLYFSMPKRREEDPRQ